MDKKYGYRRVNFLNYKADTFDCLRQCIDTIADHLESEIEILRSDNSTQYLILKTSEMLKNRGILLQTLASYTTELNGCSECVCITPIKNSDIENYIGNVRGNDMGDYM